jgi:hypothetical protein
MNLTSISRGTTVVWPVMMDNSRQELPTNGSCNSETQLRNGLGDIPKFDALLMFSNLLTMKADGILVKHVVIEERLLIQVLSALHTLASAPRDAPADLSDSTKYQALW